MALQHPFRAMGGLDLSISSDEPTLEQNMVEHTKLSNKHVSYLVKPWNHDLIVLTLPLELDTLRACLS